MCVAPILCCAGSALCCAGQLCCSCLCAPLKAAGVQAKQFSKIGYVVFDLIWILISITLMYTAYKLVDWQPLSALKCPDSAGGAANCMGPSVIIRMSFVLATMHVIVFLIATTRGTVAAIFHDGCWGTKFLYVLAFFIGSIWIPNWFFVGYLTFAKYVSFFFLFMQGMLMLMVAYKINDGLVGNYERDGS